MTTFRDMPIKEKLMVAMIATTAVALLLAGIGILVVDSYLFRTALQHDLTALATIIGDNSTAALAFRDTHVANEVLGALHSKPHIVEACTYTAEGNILARYARAGAPAACPAPGQKEIAESGSDDFLVSHPILLDGRRIGTVVMLYDLGEVTERTKLYGGVVLLVLPASSFLAFLFSTRLRAVIAMPVTRLAEAARNVTRSGSYAIRVQRDSGDELRSEEHTSEL